MRAGRFITITTLALASALAYEGQPVYHFEALGNARVASAETFSLFYPSGVAVDVTGAVWISDTANHVIRRVSPDGQFELFAGKVGIVGSDDGHREDATFRYPQGLAFDHAGNLYIADSGNSTIRRLRPDGIVETWAGRSDERGHQDGDRNSARFITPMGLAWDITGDLWVSDFSAHTIRKVDRDGRVMTVSGKAGTPGFRDGDGVRARFVYPAGIDLDAQGRLWIADSGNGLIRVVSRDSFTATMAGNSETPGHRDGPPDQAGFDHPADVAVRSDGVVFVTDSWSHTIRMITDEGVSTIAGAPGLSGNLDGSGRAARFHYPLAIALAPDGTIFVTDMANHLLRQGTEAGFGERRRRPVGR